MAAAQSLYRGFRITLTEHPGAEHCYVTLAVKQVRGRWDEWSLMFPALRLPVDSKEGAPALADLIRRAVELVEEELYERE